MPKYAPFPGVRLIVMDKIRREDLLEVPSSGDLYVGPEKSLIFQTTPQGHIIPATPAYDKPPSTREVHALIQRYRMVRGELPDTVLVTKVVEAHPRTGADVVLGYTVILRGADRRMSA